jgi:hypothetical protein
MLRYKIITIPHNNNNSIYTYYTKSSHGNILSSFFFAASLKCASNKSERLLKAFIAFKSPFSFRTATDLNGFNHLHCPVSEAELFVEKTCLLDGPVNAAGSIKNGRHSVSTRRFTARGTAEKESILLPDSSSMQGVDLPPPIQEGPSPKRFTVMVTRCPYRPPDIE